MPTRTTDPYGPRLHTWARWSDWPLTALAALFLLLYATQVLYLSAPTGLSRVVDGAIWLAWVLFALDYLVRLAVTRHRVGYVLHHLFDLLVVALPLMRPLRALRVLTVVTVLNRHVMGSVRGRVGVYTCGILLLVGFCASLAVLDAERGVPGASITSFPGAVWWTLTTVTTVGYGDLYPVSPEGRLVAAALMVGGIALLGVTTGFIASWFVERVEDARATEARTAADIRAVRAELAGLRLELGDAVQHFRDVGRRQVPVGDEPDPPAHRAGQHADLGQ